MKKLALSVIVFFSIMVSSFAQTTVDDIQPVKDGDRLGIKYTVFDEKGKGEIFEKSSQNRQATFSVNTDGYIIKYDDGRIETYDNTHTIIKLLSGGKTTEFKQNEQITTIPKDLSIGKKEGFTYWSNPACGPTKITFDNIFVEEGIRVLKIKGVEKQIPVQIINHKGKWSCSGEGRQELIIVFSKQLKLILERKLLSFDRQDKLFPFSDSRKIESIN